MVSSLDDEEIVHAIMAKQLTNHKGRGVPFQNFKVSFIWTKYRRIIRIDRWIGHKYYLTFINDLCVIQNLQGVLTAHLAPHLDTDGLQAWVHAFDIFNAVAEEKE